MLNPILNETEQQSIIRSQKTQEFEGSKSDAYKKARNAVITTLVLGVLGAGLLFLGVTQCEFLLIPGAICSGGFLGGSYVSYKTINKYNDIQNSHRQFYVNLNTTIYNSSSAAALSRS